MFWMPFFVVLVSVLFSWPASPFLEFWLRVFFAAQRIFPGGTVNTGARWSCFFYMPCFRAPTAAAALFAWALTHGTQDTNTCCLATHTKQQNSQDQLIRWKLIGLFSEPDNFPIFRFGQQLQQISGHWGSLNQWRALWALTLRTAQLSSKVQGSAQPLSLFERIETCMPLPQWPTLSKIASQNDQRIEDICTTRSALWAFSEEKPYASRCSCTKSGIQRNFQVFDLLVDILTSHESWAEIDCWA